MLKSATNTTQAEPDSNSYYEAATARITSGGTTPVNSGNTSTSPVAQAITPPKSSPPIPTPAPVDTNPQSATANTSTTNPVVQTADTALSMNDQILMNMVSKLDQVISILGDSAGIQTDLLKYTIAA